jgi:hypothetical protein
MATLLVLRTDLMVVTDQMVLMELMEKIWNLIGVELASELDSKVSLHIAT